MFTYILSVSILFQNIYNNIKIINKTILHYAKLYSPIVTKITKIVYLYNDASIYSESNICMYVYDINYTSHNYVMAQ